MDIEFRNFNGERVGFIIGTDVKDVSGNRVGYINGNEIRNANGNRAGLYSGNDIKDNYGKRIGFLNGNEIRDTKNNRVGYPVGDASQLEIIAAALLLFDLEPAVAAVSPTRSSSSSSGGSSFGFWALLGLFLFAFWHFLKGPFVAFSLIKETSARKEWWGTVVRSFFLSILFVLVMNSIFNDPGEITAAILLIFLLAFGMLPIIVVSIRRMHDIGKSGWWILIPLVNFVMCGFFPGKIEDNPYV
jgi:uncharacterized membrane protein YhaH (DUF805 family)